MNRLSTKLVAFSLLVLSYSVLSNAPTTSTGELVAARWHQRARTGQLHYRASAAGRGLPHTVVPTSVRGKQLPPRVTVSPVVSM